jgi:hypothetical protein
VFGIRSAPVPRKQRLAWAVIAMGVTLGLYVSRANRYDIQPSVPICLLLAYISAGLGYYGCTWRRGP